MKCPKCYEEIDEEEDLQIHGTAHVTGLASLRDFVEYGVIWTTHDSWDERFQCPYCDELFEIDYEEVESRWE